MSETAPVAARPGQEDRTTSRRTAVLLGLLLLGVMVVRVPALYAALERDFPPEMAAELGDPQLQTLALRIGLAVGLLVSFLSVAVFLFLARQLEKAVLPRTVTVLGLELGLHTTVYAVSALLSQGASVLWTTAVAANPLAHLGCALIASGCGVLVLSEPLRRATPRSRTIAVVSAFLLSALASWNWIP